MALEIKTEGNVLKVAVEGRLVAAVVPEMREAVLGRMSKGTNVLFDLS